MPMLSVIAPETPVRVEGMSLPNARVVQVGLKAGPNPLVYLIEWGEAGAPRRKASFFANVVFEIDAPVGPA